MIEVYSMSDPRAADRPCARAIFDVTLTSVDYLGEHTLIASDIQGNFHILSNITDQDNLGLKQINTKFERIR